MLYFQKQQTGQEQQQVATEQKVGATNNIVKATNLPVKANEIQKVSLKMIKYRWSLVDLEVRFLSIDE